MAASAPRGPARRKCPPPTHQHKIDFPATHQHKIDFPATHQHKIDFPATHQHKIDGGFCVT